MIEETVMVESASDGVAWVKSASGSSCGHCKNQSGCGLRFLNQHLNKGYSRLPVMDTIGVSVGEEVVIGINGAVLVKGSLRTYMLPLLGLLLGTMMGESLFAHDELSVLSGLLGLGAGLLMACRMNAVSLPECHRPVILRRVSPGKGIKRGSDRSI